MKKIGAVFRGRRERTKIMLSFLLIGAVLVIAFSTIITNLNVQRATEVELENFSERFALTGKMADYVFYNVFENSYYLYKDSAEAHIAMYNSSYSTEDKHAITRLFRTVHAFSDLIESVYFVNANAGMVCSTDKTIQPTDAFQDQGALPILTGDVRDVFTLRENAEGKEVMSFGFSNAWNSYDVPVSGMLVNMYADIIWEIFNSGDTSSNAIWLITKNGQVLSPDSHVKENVFTEELMTEILQGTREIDHIITEVAGEKSLVVFQRSSSFGLRFVSIIPYNELLNRTMLLRNQMISVTIITVLLAFIGALLFARQLYKPLQTMVEQVQKGSDSVIPKGKGEYEYLMDTYRQMINTANSNERFLLEKSGKKQELYKLLMGTANVEKALEINGLNQQYFAVVVIRIFGLENRLGQYDAKDIDLLKFGIGNVAGEVIGAEYNCVPIENGSDFITVIINMDQKIPIHAYRTLIEKVSTQAATALQLQLSCGASEFVEQKSNQIATAFRQASRAVEYDLIYGPQKVMLWEDISDVESDAPIYPDDLEHAIINSMVQGNFIQVKTNMEAFYTLLISGNIQDGKLWMQKLAVRISHTLNTEQFVGKDQQLSYASYDLLKNVTRADTLESVKVYLLEIIQEYISVMAAEKGEKWKKVLDKALIYLEENYSNPNLSAEDIAVHARYSTSYLRRIFKETYDCSPIDYLFKLRMEKAKTLLATTKMSTSNIAESVGYTNTKYFYKLFKKDTGLTATEYRKAQAMKEGSG